MSADVGGMRDNSAVTTHEPLPASARFDDPADAPRSDDLARLDRIRDAFAAAGFTVDGVEARLGGEAAAALHRDLLVPAEFALGEADDALAALIRVYLLAQPVALATLPAGQEQIEAGLLEPMPGKLEQHGAALVRARVDIRPYATAAEDGTVDLWVASDLGGVQLAGSEAGDRPLRRDHVVGIGPATTNLAQLTPRTRVGRALDLGVGMGVQTMHLVAHADHVVATDISARALEFARFNLTFNAVALGLDAARLDERVSLRLGDLLAPVAGEQFDLVVSNPPFVITPRREAESASEQYTYRDGGRPGDRLVEDLIRGLGAHLAEGGLVIMLGNWEIHSGDATWHSRVEAWPGDGIDLWIVQRERATPIEYADMWLKDAQENRELTSWRAQFARYLDGFAARGVEAVGMGMLILHRPATVGAPVRRFETLEHQLEQPLGARIHDAAAADDWLRDHSDDDLLDETFVVAPDVTEERHAIPGAEHPSAMLLRQGGGFRRTFPETTELAAFVSVCDGELTAGQILAALGALLEVPDAELRASVLRDVRDLVAYGFLVPRWM